MRGLLTSIARCAVVLAAASALAAPPAPEERDDLGGPETPRGAVRGYVAAAREGRFDQAARFLDLSALAPDARDTDGPVLARHLKIVLDQKLWIDFDALSDRPEGNTEDGYPAHVDRVGSIATPRGDVDILVKRLTDDGASVWKFSRATVRHIPDLYAQYGYGPFAEMLPDWALRGRFLEIEVWQWIGLAAVLVIAGLVGLVLVWLATRAIRPLAARTDTTLDDQLLHHAVVPARLIVALAVFAVGTRLLSLSLPARETLAGLEKGLAVLLVTWILLKCVNLLEDAVRQHLVAEGRTALVAALPLGRRTLKVALLLLALIALLQNLGFNVTGLLAGLGVGGLAIALAAQKTIENLFGGVAVTVDQPVRVGDFCRFGDKTGTVEDIGLRSTKIRTLDRTVITVPNAEFSQVQIENFAKRDRMRLALVLGLRYETTPDQLRHVLAGLRDLLVAHPRILPDPCRVRLVAFGSHSLDVEVFAYVDTADFEEFLAVREDVFLRIMDVVTASGTGFAFPTQTLHLGRDGGLDEDRARAAEAEVRAWREAGVLPFPDADAGAKESRRGTLDYPPKGSVAEGRGA